MRILVLVFTLVLIATAAHSKAQDTQTWVSKKVVFKEPTHSPIASGDSQEPVSSQVFTVKRANRDLLYIVAGEAGFWVPSHELLLQEKVSDYLTDQIRLKMSATPQAYSKRGFSGWEEGLRQCHRRLRRGDQAHPEECPGALRPSHRLATQEGFRQGDRRFQRCNSARSPVGGSLQHAGMALGDLHRRQVPRRIEGHRIGSQGVRVDLGVEKGHLPGHLGSSLRRGRRFRRRGQGPDRGERPVHGR